MLIYTNPALSTYKFVTRLTAFLPKGQYSAYIFTHISLSASLGRFLSLNGRGRCLNLGLIPKVDRLAGPPCLTHHLSPVNKFWHIQIFYDIKQRNEGFFGWFQTWMIVSKIFVYERKKTNVPPAT